MCKNIVNIQKVQNGYVRPLIWRGSEMMAISAQKNKIHVAVATWEWGSYFDPKLKLNGIKLNISKWRRPAPNTIPCDTKASGLYMICTLSKHDADREGYSDSLMLVHEGNIAEATGANLIDAIMGKSSVATDTVVGNPAFPWSVDLTFTSLILVFVGIGFALASLIDGYLFNDPYPGYGSVGKDRNENQKEINRMIEELCTS